MSDRDRLSPNLRGCAIPGTISDPGLSHNSVGPITRARVAKDEKMQQKFTVYGAKIRVLKPERSKSARLELASGYAKLWSWC